MPCRPCADGFDVDLDVARIAGNFTPVTCCYLVELPGIEPAPEIVLSCENTRFADAKRREMTCGYAECVDGINSTSQSLPMLTTMLSPVALHHTGIRHVRGISLGRYSNCVEPLELRGFEPLP